jgi:hypothetical protein
LQEKYDERNHEQNVDESTQRVGTDDSQQPQNQKDHKDCPKHVLTSRGYAQYSSTGIDTTNALTPDGGPLVVYPRKFYDAIRSRHFTVTTSKPICTSMQLILVKL